MAITAPARLIDSWEIVRLNAVTLSLPNIIALRLTSIAPNVFTFIPPAVDCDAPPIHIRNIMKIRVPFRNEAGLTDTKPELLGVVELKID